MLMKWFLSFTIVLSCFLIINHGAFCSETYYIDNNRVLLYKVINWWYDCLPEESSLLCGSLIKCQSKGNVQVEYNEAEMILSLQIKGGFANLLSIFKQCEQCFGPYLKCTWLNKKFFGRGEALIVSNEVPTMSAFIINNIDKKQGRLIRSIEKDIIFELEGVIGGLLNGKIALHQAGNFIKDCSGDLQNRNDSSPISLKIINPHTKEVLAKYSAILK